MCSAAFGHLILFLPGGGGGCGEAGEEAASWWLLPHPPQGDGAPVSFFPCREHELELLQEELGRMEMSCLQGQTWLGTWNVVQGMWEEMSVRSEASAHSHPLLGHVCYPSVSLSSARPCAPP